MRIALIVLGALVVVAVISYFMSIPRNTFIILKKPGGGAITFSRTSASFEAAPDHYATKAFEHIEPYVSRLIIPTNRFKFLNFFTPDGTRGFGFHAKDGLVEATLTIEWRQEAHREADVREFFKSLGLSASRDYLAGNGGVPDATRILHYPINGNAAEITALTKRMLKELCGVSPDEPLDISYSEK